MRVSSLKDADPALIYLYDRHAWFVPEQTPSRARTNLQLTGRTGTSLWIPQLGRRRRYTLRDNPLTLDRTRRTARAFSELRAPALGHRNVPSRL